MGKSKTLMERLNGKKTYLVSAITFLYAVSGLLGGFLDEATALSLILGALGLGSLRHGISKAEYS